MQPRTARCDNCRLKKIKVSRDLICGVQPWKVNPLSFPHNSAQKNSSGREH